MSQISEIMTNEVITVARDTPILDAIEILVKYNVTGLPVVNAGGELVGIVTEKDLLKHTTFNKEHLIIFRANRIVAQLLLQTICGCNLL